MTEDEKSETTDEAGVATEAKLMRKPVQKRAKHKCQKRRRRT
jgi:hypothetical protein